jgi:hypothetical protein
LIGRFDFSQNPQNRLLTLKSFDTIKKIESSDCPKSQMINSQKEMNLLPYVGIEDLKVYIDYKQLFMQMRFCAFCI